VAQACAWRERRAGCLLEWGRQTPESADLTRDAAAPAQPSPGVTVLPAAAAADQPRAEGVSPRGLQPRVWTGRQEVREGQLPPLAADAPVAAWARRRAVCELGAADAPDSPHAAARPGCLSSCRACLFMVGFEAASRWHPGRPFVR